MNLSRKWKKSKRMYIIDPNEWRCLRSLMIRLNTFLYFLNTVNTNNSIKGKFDSKQKNISRIPSNLFINIQNDNQIVILILVVKFGLWFKN